MFHCRRGLTNLIHDSRGCTLFTLSYVGTIVVRVYFTLGRSPVEANCVNKSGANRRVSYDTLTHSRLYSRDREKK